MSGAFDFGPSTYLIDNSFFARITHPLIRPIWEQGVDRGRLVSCGPFVLEALYSARDADDAERLRLELLEGIAYVAPDEGAWRNACAAQVALAHVSERFHRRPPIEYLIAATAGQHGLGVLHYDRYYDHIANHAALDFESRWIAEPGSL